MKEAAEVFMDSWLDANVTRKRRQEAERQDDQGTCKAMYARCGQCGFSLDSLEEVVVDIEEAIADELNFMRP